MKIRPGSLVLEVGSGNSPRHESSVLCDRFIHNNSQRAGAFSIVINRPFVVADGYNLPFKDNVFDYVICSHVLEHLENPKLFINELMRVARAGYIEVPSIYGERLFGWDFHLWYCQLRNKKLIFSSKKEGERYEGFFHRLIAHSLAFRKFFEKYENTFYIRYEWKKSVNFQIKPISNSELEKVDKENFSLLKKMDWNFPGIISFWCTWMLRRVQNKGKKTKRNILWNIKKKLIGKAITQNLLPLMQCVVCKSSLLEIKQKTVSCEKCKSTFPIDGVIPVMLTKKELQKGY